MKEQTPNISAVICTRNRGYSVVPTVASILSNTHPNFEVILVDQSTSTDTEQSIRKFLDDPRFHYIHSNTVGTGQSRNIGLQEARGKIVAYADDDCIVSPQWLETLEPIFDTIPEVALVYCRIDPAPYDSQKGYIPILPINEDRLLKKMSDCFTEELGLGAGMAVRKDFIAEIGGFDRNLGPGSYFRSGEDRDIAIRVILKKRWVYFASKIPVIHHGFRTFEQGKEHAKRDFFSLGAAYIKPVKCGYFSSMIMFITIPLLQSWFEPYIRILQLKKPYGLKKPFHFCMGVIKGLQTPVDRDSILYRFD